MEMKVRYNWDHVLLHYLIYITLLSLTACTAPHGISERMSDLDSDFCQGFDFNKKFLGVEGRPWVVDYDTTRKRLHNQDGLYYCFYFNDSGSTKKFYTNDLKLSEKERKYIESYEINEKKFDNKYAGKIKQKLYDTSKLRIRSDGKELFTYPRYLQGDALPEGLYTPMSFYSKGFILSYLEARNQSGDLRKYIIAVMGSNKSWVYDHSGFVKGHIIRQASDRLYSLYSDYVLTYFFLKNYKSESERHQASVDISNYYRDVVFRAAAESMYYSLDKITARQRCKIANHVADRMRNFVMTLSDHNQMENIKKEYSAFLIDQCYSNLHSVKIQPVYYSKEFSKDEVSKLRDELKKDVFSGKVRCEND